LVGGETSKTEHPTSEKEAIIIVIRTYRVDLVIAAAAISPFLLVQHRSIDTLPEFTDLTARHLMSHQVIQQ
jgi:hypothetical protein